MTETPNWIQCFHRSGSDLAVARACSDFRSVNAAADERCHIIVFHGQQPDEDDFAEVDGETLRDALAAAGPFLLAYGCWTIYARHAATQARVFVGYKSRIYALDWDHIELARSVQRTISEGLIRDLHELIETPKFDQIPLFHRVYDNALAVLIDEMETSDHAEFLAVWVITQRRALSVSTSYNSD